MQKKFKHKKTGEIATYQDGVLKSSGFCVEIGVEPSSEFWEVISEKDFEIVLWSFGNEDRFKTKNPDGTAIKYNIHSVKRLSDGEVFTIGDKINGLAFQNIEINEIWLNPKCNTQILFNHKDEGICFLKASKARQPLFTTEDGVDRIKGDEIHFVDCYFKYQGKYIACENTLKLFPNRRIFSTKEAAENYIICNKPCLSFNDAWNISNNKSSDNHYVIIDKRKLKELVKSKL
jgi:hypothetical protein